MEVWELTLTVPKHVTCHNFLKPVCYEEKENWSLGQVPYAVLFGTVQ